MINLSIFEIMRGAVMIYSEEERETVYKAIYIKEDNHG